MLFNLRLKELLKGVRIGLIDAADPSEAEAIGRAYCGKIRGATFIGIEPAILADASILSEASDEAAAVRTRLREGLNPQKRTEL